jgi:hypothetical protein
MNDETGNRLGLAATQVLWVYSPRVSLPTADTRSTGGREVRSLPVSPHHETDEASG